VPSYAICFATYNWVRGQLESQEEPNAAVQLFAGGLSGVTAWLGVYPIDVIKSRMQVTADRPF
jgi:solute carrier family 25 (mitochondrial carnitine/acylcarnitine transporter), member 20/29